MNFKRIISIILAVCLIMTIAVGCGGDTAGTQGDNSQSTGTTGTNEQTNEGGNEKEQSSDKGDSTSTEKKMIKSKDKIKVLVIGHSFSNNSTQYASQMVADFGGDLEISSLYYAGCTLEQHYDFYNNNEAVFQLYTNGYLVTQELVTSKWVLENHEYDYIAFQGHSVNMDDIETFDKLVPLYEIVKRHQPNAKFMIHQTWSLCWRRNAGRGYSAKLLGRDQFEKVEANFKIASERLGNVPIVPVGEAVQLAKEEYGFTNDYDKVTSIYADEVSHLSEKGRYLAACVWAQFMYKDEIDVRQNTYLGSGVNNEERQKLAEVAYKIVMGE